MPGRTWRAAGAPLVLALLSVAAAQAEAFPPITAEERALTAVPGQPNAPAVVLVRAGWLRMMDPAKHEVSSVLQVRMRIKILTEAGKEAGNARIAHSGSFRLQGIEGRTVLPDGTVVPLPKDARFQRTASSSRRLYVTSVAFPAVQVGAILDYQYTVRWDSIFFLDPWYFQDRIPALHSEIVYEVPNSLHAASWKSDPMRVGIRSEITAGPGGSRVRAWADNLPAVPDEPFGLPFSDVAAQVMMLPTAFVSRGAWEGLLESWEAACRLFDEQLQAARRKDGDAARQAQLIAGRVAAQVPSGGALPLTATATAGASAAPAAGASLPWRQAAAIYAFVRDEIATEDARHVWLPESSTVGGVLERRRGEPAEKALLLQTMLAALKIDSRLVWAADRADGVIDMQVPNPGWFDRVLVAAQIDGRRVFLDPVDHSLTFGHLDPGYEGTYALVIDRNKPETITLPESSFSANLRRARLELTVDAGGRATGTGALSLQGQPAWQRTRWSGGAASPTAAWESWLAKELPGFAIAGVQLSESLDEPRVELSWSMSQHPEEALGDQASFNPSRPVGPVRQLFPAGVKRQSMVVFDFAERSEVELVLHWAAGWQPEIVPRGIQYQTAAGAVVSGVEVDAAHRTLTYRRRFDNVRRQASSAEQFKLLRALFEEAQKTDAQALVLSRR